MGSLGVRLAIMLSIAILPLGLIAIYQTETVIAEAEALEGRVTLSRTLRAANAERALLRNVYGAADGLGTAVAEIGSDSTACDRILTNFAAETDDVVFAGFIEMDGIMRCSSAPNEVDFSAFPEWLSFVANPRRTITVTPNGEVSGQAVIVVTAPVVRGGEIIGALSVSVPRDITDTLTGSGPGGIHVAIMDADGNIMDASGGIADTDRFDVLRLSPGLLDLSEDGALTTYMSADGREVSVAIVPIIDQEIFAVGLFDDADQNVGIPLFGATFAAFPLLMWLVAIGVALYSVDRLVLRHLKRLEAKMSALSLDDPEGSFANLKKAPGEIEAMAATYNKMIDHILADRAALAETIAEKELLLREVHHRVKNNLQLIASILNMQMRTVKDGPAYQVLQRVQDRVLSLSSIHKALYTGTALASVRADRLLGEVVQGALSVGTTANMGLETETVLDPVELDPDQAVPLALLANELVTNALKYVGRPAEGPPSIAIRLSDETGEIVFSIANSTGVQVSEINAMEGTGLGATLIDAFTAQLGGTLETETEGNTYRVMMRFAPLPIGADQSNQDLTDDDTLPGDPSLAAAS